MTPPAKAATPTAPTEHLPRTWFKKDMRQAILDGYKVRTTRDHPLKLGWRLAVSGPYYDAKPFTRLKIIGRLPTTFGRVIVLFYDDEGFQSPNQMETWGKKEGLLKGDYQNQSVFCHEFIPYTLDGQPIQRRHYA